jgi:ParB family transcriptional regulator, chromosome partitioning protein
MNKTERPYKGSLASKVDILLGGQPQEQKPQVVKLEQIVFPKYQPRQYFDPQKLEDLAISIERQGILEPLLVRQLDNGTFELIAGGRRFRAAQLAQLREVPIVILSLSDEEALEVAILENLQREDLNPVEETEGILHLLTSRLQCSKDGVISLLHRMRNEVKGQVSRNISAKPEIEIVEDVFKPLGLTWKSFVETRLPLLKLPEKILEALNKGQIEYTKAKAIASVKQEEIRNNLLAEAIKEQLSLSQIKEKIKQLNENINSEQKQKETPINQFQQTYLRVKKSKLWEKNPKKWKRVETLLQKLEALIEEEE